MEINKEQFDKKKMSVISRHRVPPKEEHRKQTIKTLATYNASSSTLYLSPAMIWASMGKANYGCYLVEVSVFSVIILLLKSTFKSNYRLGINCFVSLRR